MSFLAVIHTLQSGTVQWVFSLSFTHSTLEQFGEFSRCHSHTPLWNSSVSCLAVLPWNDRNTSIRIINCYAVTNLQTHIQSRITECTNILRTFSKTGGRISYNVVAIVTSSCCVFSSLLESGGEWSGGGGGGGGAGGGGHRRIHARIPCIVACMHTYIYARILTQTQTDVLMACFKSVSLCVLRYSNIKHLKLTFLVSLTSLPNY